MSLKTARLKTLIMRVLKLCFLGTTIFLQGVLGDPHWNFTTHEYPCCGEDHNTTDCSLYQQDMRLLNRKIFAVSQANNLIAYWSIVAIYVLYWLVTLAQCTVKYLRERSASHILTTRTPTAAKARESDASANRVPLRGYCAEFLKTHHAALLLLIALMYSRSIGHIFEALSEYFESEHESGTCAR